MSHFCGKICTENQSRERMCMTERRANNIRNGKEIIDDARREGHEVIIGNQELPTADYLLEIGESMRDNVFTILLGATGSGKSTQTPQVAYSMGKTVDHTQPRRSAAHEIANRIQYELEQAVPGLPPNTAAIHTGEESTVSHETQITVFTDGMLLAVGYNPTRNILDTPKEDHITIIDEVHEGNKNIEVLIGLLMRESRTNPDLRVVLMTATPNKEFLISRINEITGITPNVVEVPGRTYPVERLEWPEYTSVEATVKLAKPGAGFMVYKQGIVEIQDTIREITRGLPPELRKKTRFFKYHSTIAANKLSEAINYEQADDEIKIMVGTNAMESSITARGITYVIDDGQARQMWTDKRGYEGLYSMPISQDRCLQRAGRAGRERPGIAILVRPDNRTAFVPFDQRPEHELAEIHRRDLKNEVLELAAIGIDIEDLAIINGDIAGDLSLKLKIIRAKESLAILGALDADGNITDIGLEMNKYPVRATLKRTLVESRKYSTDIQVMVAAMAAAVDGGGLPLYGRYASNNWKELSSEGSSDLLRQLDLFIEVRSMSAFEQNAIGINPKSIARAEETYEKILHQLGLKDGDLRHPNEIQREEMIRCIYAGHVEYIFQRMGRNTFRLLQDSEPTAYKLSDRSVVDPRRPNLVVGVPYIVEQYSKGEKRPVHIIEAVTEVPSIDVLGEAAVNMAHWSDEEIVWRGGRAFLRSEQSIRGMKSGAVTEAMGNSEDIRNKTRELITYVLEHPGPAQMQLRNIKKELEELNHLSKDDVTRMTQEGLLEYIEMAISRLNVFDAHYLDNELMLIIQENDINLRTYISDDELRRIYSNAPGEIIVGDTVLDVGYRNGKPTVKRYDESFILSLENDVYLPDGRNVRFLHEGKHRMKAMDLKRLILDSRAGK